MEGKPGSSASEVQQQPELRSFYTSAQEKKESPQTEIIETYAKLNSTIDDLEVHIEDAIKKHEAEFLFAYRNHMKKIKKELAELRKRSDEQEKEFSSNDKIVYLEKQITIFREEALKLYDKLEQKNHEAEELRMQLKIFEKENSNYEKDMKEMMRKLKGMELQLHKQHGREEEVSAMLDSPRSKKTPDRYLPSINPNDSKLTANMSNLQGLSKPVEAILKQYVAPDSLQQATQDIIAWVRSHDQQLKEKLERTSVHRRKQPIQPLLQNTDFQLKEWFLDCVRSIKREIFKRKQQAQPQQLTHVTDINDFLSIDKLRLLEIFLTNEQLLSHMYLKMFPDRLTELREMLVKKPLEEREKDRQRNISMVDRPTPDYEYEDIQRPSVVMHKQREPRSLLRNRIMIKNGKLNFSNM